MELFACLWNCIRRIPWWAWVLLAVAAAVIAALTFWLTPILTGVAITWLQAALAGVGGTFGATLLNCLIGCLRTQG